jgi:hypothetical protein
MMAGSAENAGHNRRKAVVFWQQRKVKKLFDTDKKSGI